MGVFGFIKKQIDAANQKKEDQQKQEAIKREEAIAARESLKIKIAGSAIIDALFNEFKRHDWIFCRQSAVDDGCREIQITSDTVGIKWFKMRYDSHIVGQDKWGIDIYKSEYVEEVYGHVEYSFTKSGYAPLGKYDCTEKELFAEVIAERMETLIYGTYSGSTYLSSDFNATKTYTLPAPMQKLF